MSDFPVLLEPSPMFKLLHTKQRLYKTLIANEQSILADCRVEVKFFNKSPEAREFLEPFVQRAYDNLITLQNELKSIEIAIDVERRNLNPCNP